MSIKRLADAENDDDFVSFRDKHDTSPIGVWLVFEFGEIRGEDADRVGVFSSLEKADAWAKATHLPCIISPYIIDEPEWGEGGKN